MTIRSKMIPVLSLISVVRGQIGRCGIGLTVIVSGLGGQTEIYDSGGPLMPEQAAYDVFFYDLSLRVQPEEEAILGRLTAHARAVRTLEWMVLDLDTLLAVHEVTDGANGRRLAFERRGGKLWARLARPVSAGDTVVVAVEYGGRPLSAPHRQTTWSDGFVWTRTEAGAPWIGVISVLNGADIWWPTKDHPSDEPDSMALHVTVPAPLIVAANGRLRAVETNDDETSTFHWFVSTPINNYGVTINVAPYRVIEDTYRSVTGETVPIAFWVLPEHHEAGLRQFPQFKEHLRFFEEILGPYPFRIDKYGVAETPYLGMEHQSIISYGSDFGNNDFGFDWLHFHELAHEWWANMVTAGDWKDWWLHESFASYLEALYAEHLGGEGDYHAYLPDRPLRFANAKPVAPRESQRTRDIYGGDIYGKGAWILHSLRYLIGKDALLRAMRRMIYPDSTLESVPGGCQCRQATTEEFRRTVERIAGRDLGWFFEVYLRQPALPILHANRRDDTLVLRWEIPDGLPFPMPLDVTVDGESHRVDMTEGAAVLTVPAGAEFRVDPGMWVLMDYRESPN